jgi:hypothetical protein
MIHYKWSLKKYNIHVSPYIEVMSQDGGYPQAVTSVVFTLLTG